MCNYSDFVEEYATKRGLEKGMQQGLQQGETKLGQLVAVLLKDGLTEVIERVAVDEEARAEYYKKYNIN